MRLSSLLVLLSAWGLTPGCASPGAQSIVGPDGSRMAHVHCGSDQGTCFRIAGELCPGGYELKPVLEGSDGNFLVRCRARAGATVAAACSTPPVASKTHDAWPPAAEPWPAAYPWTAPETSAAAQKPQAAPAQAPVEIDLGY
jgi:hypothetical protein